MFLIFKRGIDDEDDDDDDGGVPGTNLFSTYVPRLGKATIKLPPCSALPCHARRQLRASQGKASKVCMFTNRGSSSPPRCRRQPLPAPLGMVFPGPGQVVVVISWVPKGLNEGGGLGRWWPLSFSSFPFLIAGWRSPDQIKVIELVWGLLQPPSPVVASAGMPPLPIEEEHGMAW